MVNCPVVCYQIWGIHWAQWHLSEWFHSRVYQYISFESASISKIRSLGNFFSDFAVMNINWLISEFEERISIFDSFCWWANKIVTFRRTSKLLSKNKLRFYLFFDVYSFFFFVFCIIILLSIAVFIRCFTSFVNCLFCFVAQLPHIHFLGSLCRMKDNSVIVNHS